MFTNLTYKSKLKILWGIAIVLLFLCYRFAFSKTFEQYNIYKDQYASNTILNNKGNLVENLKIKERKINSFFSQFVLDTLQNEKNLLFVCSEFCKSTDLKIKDYTPYNISTGGNLKKITKSITVEGSFQNILTLIYHLETQKKTGYVISSNLKSSQDPRDKSTKLNCTIYIQNLLFTDHEN